MAGLAVSGYLAAYAVCQLFYGPFGDRVGPIRLIRMSLLSFAVATAASALAPTLGALIALRILTGVAAAAVIPMSLAQIGDTVPLEGRTRALGLFVSTLMAGQALGAAIGGLLAQVASWRIVFLLLGALALVLAHRAGGEIPVRAADRAPSRLGRPNPRDGGSIVRLGWRLYVCLGVESLALAGALPFIGPALVDRYGLGYAAVGGLLALFAVGALIGTQIRLRAAPARIYVGGALLSFAFLSLAAPAGVLPNALSIVALGVGFTLAHATLQNLATEIAPSRRASALSFFSFTANACGAVGAVVTGLVFDDFGSGVALAAPAAVLVVFTALAPLVLSGPRHARNPITTSGAGERDIRRR